MAQYRTFNVTGTFTPYGSPYSPATGAGGTLLVQCWGSGGAGGTATGYPACGGGGAGGSFAQANATAVTNGTSYTVTVGATKTTGASQAANVGNPTWFNTSGTVYAQGGDGGYLATTNSSNGNGGTASKTSCIGDVTWEGGDGYAGAYATPRSGCGGGGAGVGSDGNNATSTNPGAANGEGGAGGAGVTSKNPGNPGSTSAGGGAGGYASNATDQSGGSGARGYMIIQFQLPTDVLLLGCS